MTRPTKEEYNLAIDETLSIIKKLDLKSRITEALNNIDSGISKKYVIKHFLPDFIDIAAWLIMDSIEDGSEDVLINEVASDYAELLKRRVSVKQLIKPNQNDK